MPGTLLICKKKYYMLYIVQDMCVYMLVLYYNETNVKIVISKSNYYLKLMALAARSLLHSAVSGNGNGKYGLSLS